MSWQVAALCNTPETLRVESYSPLLFGVWNIVKIIISRSEKTYNSNRFLCCYIEFLSVIKIIPTKYKSFDELFRVDVHDMFGNEIIGSKYY